MSIRIVVGFPPPVRAEKAGDLTGCDGEAQVVDGERLAVALTQMASLNHQEARRGGCCALPFVCG